MLFCGSSGLSKVYNFNPAFRAENSQTRRHLAEFWMVEAEEAFLSGPEGLQKLMNRIEDLLKSSLQRVLDNNEEDVLTHWKQNEHAEVSNCNLIKDKNSNLYYFLLTFMTTDQLFVLPYECPVKETIQIIYNSSIQTKF